MPPALWHESEAPAKPTRKAQALADEARRILPSLPPGQPRKVAELLANGRARNLKHAAELLKSTHTATRRAWSRAQALGSTKAK